MSAKDLARLYAKKVDLLAQKEAVDLGKITHNLNIKDGHRRVSQWFWISDLDSHAKGPRARIKRAMQDYLRDSIKKLDAQIEKIQNQQ